jgi:cytosine permease
MLPVRPALVRSIRRDPYTINNNGGAMKQRLQAWWKFDAAAETSSADNPLTPLSPEQRRGTFPLLTLAFGWGFLVTGLYVGGALGAGVPFWPDLVYASFLGNLANFIIGALVGYIGYKTACNSGLLYRIVYGNVGAYLPVVFLAILTIGWQGIVVGAFGFAWAQSFDSTTFYIVAIGAGVLFTITTYYGVKGLELVSVPSVVILVLVGLYAAYTNIDQANGWSAYLQLSNQTAAKAPMSMIQAVNLVIGSWIVGAIVMAEYTRFAKKAWVALAIPFIVLIVAQWFLQIIGAMGGIVSGTHDFTTYMLQQGIFIGGLGLLGMSLALWTTGDTNLYLPVIQTSSVFRKPKRVMTVICGLLGTILGLGIYQHFLDWINLLASIVPPLIGPVIVDFYIINRMVFHAEDIDRVPFWNPAAFIAYALGAASTFVAPATMAPSLVGLAVSMITYLVVYYLAAMLGIRLGHAKLAATIKAQTRKM